MADKHYERIVVKMLPELLVPNKVLLIYGARRVGKTDLLRQFLSDQNPTDYLWLNGDDQLTEALLAERTVSNYQRLLGTKKLLVIDEAQRIPEIGLKLKLMVDELPGLKVIATGSSVFDLTNKLGEPLVGRKNTIWLHPLAQQELAQYEDYKQTLENLEERLIYGGYPEVQQLPTYKKKEDYLNDLVNSYLLRDILEYEGIRKANKLFDLLRLLAWQVGKDVSVDELAGQLKSISRNTIEVYLDLLSKVFVIYNLRGYSGNIRKEVTKNSRWYFFDNGIRNAIVGRYERLGVRQDVGALWENYLAAERVKQQSYNQTQVTNYFWRTYDQQELDWVEEAQGKLAGFAFKWNPKKIQKPPTAWSKAYPEATFDVIHPGNYLDWIQGRLF